MVNRRGVISSSWESRTAQRQSLTGMTPVLRRGNTHLGGDASNAAPNTKKKTSSHSATISVHVSKTLKRLMDALDEKQTYYDGLAAGILN